MTSGDKPSISWRCDVGPIVVTAVSDGVIGIDPKLLPKATPQEVAPLLADAGLPVGPVSASINAFVIDLPGRRVLVDAGLGPGLVDTAGHLRANLLAAGINPETICTVLLTHLHRDHVRGLTDGEGRGVFPNAEIVLHRADHAFWMNEAEERRAPALAKQHFSIARAALAPYRDRLELFSRSGPILPGIEAIHAPGHTPGHTMYRIASGQHSLLIAGDIVHLPVLQFARPDWSIVLDVDPEAAANVRKRVLDAACIDRELVTGMHFDRGRGGYFRRTGNGFAFESSDK